jgi:hypothetical protein
MGIPSLLDNRIPRAGTAGFALTASALVFLNSALYIKYALDSKGGRILLSYLYFFGKIECQNCHFLAKTSIFSRG